MVYLVFFEDMLLNFIGENTGPAKEKGECNLFNPKVENTRKHATQSFYLVTRDLCKIQKTLHKTLKFYT
mgnify:CR=1 FL=1